MEKMCHYFDLLNWFAGSRPKKVASFAGQDVVKEIYGVQQTVVDNGWVIIEYENSARAAAGLCMFSEKAHVIEVGAIGEKGRLIGQLTQIDVWDHAGDSHTIIEAAPDPNIGKFSHNGGVYLEHVEFMDCIRNDRKPLTDIDATRYGVLVGLAAEESAAKGGCIVKID